MANLTHKNNAVHIDNASNTLTNYTDHVIAHDWNRTLSMLEDNSYGDEEQTHLLLMGNTTLNLSLYLNTTTDALYGPLLADVTTTTKTVAVQDYSGRFYKGETNVSNIRKSGSLTTLQMISATHTFTGAITRTSVVGT